MKRHSVLIPLSHDHQNALARALRLRKAADAGDAERRAEAIEFLAFVDERITPHFVEEEAMLDRVPGDGCSEELRAALDRTRDDHLRLRARFEDLRSRVDADTGLEGETLFETGRQLTDHIRFEERQLFELLQRDLDADVLRTITGADGGTARG